MKIFITGRVRLRSEVCLWGVKIVFILANIIQNFPTEAEIFELPAIQYKLSWRFSNNVQALCIGLISKFWQWMSHLILGILIFVDSLFSFEQFNIFQILNYHFWPFLTICLTIKWFERWLSDLNWLLKRFLLIFNSFRPILISVMVQE